MNNTRDDLIMFAYEIIEMDNEITDLKRELARLKQYEQKYHEELQRSVEHSHNMLGGILNLAMKPGVVEALCKEELK